MPEISAPANRPLPVPSTRLGRRAFLVGAAGAGAAIVLGACGDDEGSSGDAAVSGSDGSDGNASSGSSAAGGAFPVDIPGELGTITVEHEPQRVLSVGQYRDTDAAVALGVIPVATPDLSTFMEGGISPWVARRLDGTTPELFDAELPYERLAALEPDLILATDRSSLDEEYDLLTEIAPTLSSANGYNKDEWQLTTERIATALGRTDLVEGIVAEVEAVVSAARDGNPQFAGKTFTFGPVTADGTVNTINSTTDASVLFLQSLGLELSPTVVDLPQSAFPGRAEVSPELLDVLDADVMLLTFNTPDARAQLEANPVFQQIPAVQRGAYVALELPVAIALGFPSALSIPYGVEQLVPALQAVFPAGG